MAQELQSYGQLVGDEVYGINFDYGTGFGWVGGKESPVDRKIFKMGVDRWGDEERLMGLLVQDIDSYYSSKDRLSGLDYGTYHGAVAVHYHDDMGNSMIASVRLPSGISDTRSLIAKRVDGDIETIHMSQVQAVLLFDLMAKDYLSFPGHIDFAPASAKLVIGTTGALNMDEVMNAHRLRGQVFRVFSDGSVIVRVFAYSEIFGTEYQKIDNRHRFFVFLDSTRILDHLRN